MSIEVTVRDTETGDEETKILPLDTYLVICTGRTYVAHEQRYPTTGGTQITIKRDEGDDD